MQRPILSPSHGAKRKRDEMKDRANSNGLSEKAAPSYSGRGHLLKALDSVAGDLADLHRIS
jgi:hypothetical protein